MASNTSTCSESPCDIDFSVISTSIQMGHKMIDQILHGIHYGSDEARHLLREECDFILECKVCRNLFRSFANFVAHKRVYCSDTVEEKIEKEKFATSPMEDEAVVIQPEDPDVTNVLASNVDNTKQNVINVKDSVIKKVIDRTFEGKSKDYQLYTKVAENVVKKKALRTRHSMTLTSIDSNPNAMIVNHHKGNKSTENIASGKNSSPHKLSLPNKPDLDSKFKRDGSPKKNTLSDICALLANKKSKESNVPLRTAATNAWVGSLSGRSRKSSPKKAPEFIGMKEVKKGKDKQSRAVAVNTTDSDLEEWTNENEHTNNKPKLSGSNNNVDKSWMKICDIENNICRKCDKRFSALHSLKFHAKMKHGSSLVHYSCTECDKSFLHFASLVRHMRTVHRKLRSFIEEMRAKSQKYQHIPSGIESKDDSADLNSNPSTSEDSHPSDMEEKGSRHILPPPERKSLEQMEIDENKTSKSVDSSPRESTHKLQGKLLPYATGWKKCDRCDKVFWKAKSYSKHYNSCKRKTAKSGENMDRMRTQESSSTVNKTEPGEMEYDEQKVKRFVVANIDAKRTEALSKLKEKLMVAKHLKKKAIVNAGLKDGKSGLGSQSKILTRMSSTNQKSKVSDNSTLYKALTEERSKLRTFYRVQADREINSDESDRKDMQNHEDNNLITSTRTRHQQVHFGHEQTEKNNTIIMRTKQPTQAEAIPGLMVKTVNSTRTRNQQAHSEHGKETFVNTRTKHQQTYSEHSQEQSVKAVNTRTRLQQTHSEHAQDHTDKITNTRTKHHPDHSAEEQTNKISTVITQARHQQTHSELSEEQTDKATSVNTQTRLQQYHSEPTQNLSDKTCSVNTRTRLQQNHSELTQDLNDKTSSVNTRTRLQQNHSELTQDLSDITCSVNTRTRHQQNHSEPTQDLSDITCSVNTRTRRQQNHHEPTQDHSEPTQDLSDITSSVNTRTRHQQNHHEPTQDHSEPTQDLSDITSSVNTRTRHQQNHHEPTQDHSEPTQDLSDKISYANARLRQHQISPKPDHQHGVSSLSINTMAALEATSHVPLAIQDTPISLAETGGKAKVHTTKHSTQKKCMELQNGRGTDRYVLRGMRSEQEMVEKHQKIWRLRKQLYRAKVDVKKQH